MKVMLPFIAALTVVASAQGAAASIISDNFDSSAAMLNWPGDSTFLSIPQPGNVPGSPSVDLVAASNPYGITTFSGNSVDLDGSTGVGNNPAGELQSIVSLATGNYVVQFELSGNQRGAAPQTTVVSIGSQTQDITLSSSDPFKLYTLIFTGASGQVAFTDLGPSDQQGNMLDNVNVAAVPEPATWAMMILGFLSIGFIGYRRRSTQFRFT